MILQGFYALLIIIYSLQAVIVLIWIKEDIEQKEKIHFKNRKDFLLWLIPFVMFIKRIYSHFKEN